MKKRGDRPDYSDKATTFWLAVDTPASYQKVTLKPFGWAALDQVTEAMAAAFEKIRLEEENAASQPAVKIPSASISPEPSVVKHTEPVEEVWDDAFVSFNAGGGGVITAIKDNKKAENRIGDDRTLISEETISRIRKKKGIRTKVTVQKRGNAFEIVKVEI